MQVLLDRQPSLFAALYTVSVILPTFLTGAYAVRIRADLGFGTAELGYALSGFFLGGAVTARALAGLVDRLGASIALRVATLASAAASITVALSNGWQMVWLGMTIAGAANGVSQMATNRVLVSRASHGRQAMGFGLKQAAVPLASLAAGLTVSGLGTRVTWHAAFVVAAGLALVLSALAPRTPRRALVAPESSAKAIRPTLVVLAVCGGMAGAAGNGVSLLLVDSYDSWGAGERFGATMLSIGSLVAVASRLTAGWVVVRRRSDGRSELRTMLVAATAGFAMLASAQASTVLLVGGTLLTFAAGWGWQAVIYFTATRDTSLEPARSSGAVLFGVMLGSIAGPPIVASSAATWGYSIGWALAGCLCLIAAVLAQATVRLAHEHGGT
jgi:MFS family permease